MQHKQTFKLQRLTFMNMLNPVFSRSVSPPDMCSMSGHSGRSGWKTSSRICRRNGRYEACKECKHTGRTVTDQNNTSITARAVINSLCIRLIRSPLFPLYSVLIVRFIVLCKISPYRVINSSSRPNSLLTHESLQEEELQHLCSQDRTSH